MNKVIIVGHPQSGYQEVEKLLTTCGMHAPQPSRREGFLPDQISTTLCKAYGIPPVAQLKADAVISQIEAGSVWHGMALDLLLGNIDQALWGWSDPQTIYLLDYWKSLDTNLTFVFVYDEPHSVLSNNDALAETPDPEAYERQLRIWNTYNAALLHFFLRNPDRCLLVHAKQVALSASHYLQQVSALINSPLDATQAMLAEAVSNLEENQAAVADETDVSDTALSQPNGQLPAISPGTTEGAAVKHYLAAAFVNDYPDNIQLYEELQSVANLPLANPTSAACSPLQAWLSLHELQQGILKQYQAKTRALAEAEQLTEEAQAENGLLLTQLHQVQEELERHYLETKTLKSRAEQLAKAKAEQEQTASQNKTQAEALAKQLDAQAKQTQERETHLKALQSKLALAEEAKEENELLLLQLHQVQEELERYYLEVQALKSPAKQQPGAQNTHLYGAAERVKNQLAYRLGAVMVSHSKSIIGWLKMPWALLNAYSLYRTEKKRKTGEKLPPVAEYMDAYEGDRVKQHLSYKLGIAWLNNIRTPLGWIKLPFALYQAIESFKQSKH